MNASIRYTRASCMFCTKIAPYQTKEPINLTQSPDWPFQQIVMDLFYVGNHGYLACADRLTGWLILYYLSHGQANASRLISVCRDIFQSYGASEELSSNGGPPFKSLPFTQILRDWTVKHRLSSAAYPQSNGRAELAVKSAKRIISGNTGAQGLLDNDRASKSHPPIQEYTHSKYRTIPAQLLLHRRLHDFISSQPHPLQATRWLDSCSKKSRDNSISSERPSHRAIQQNNTHLISPI